MAAVKKPSQTPNKGGGSDDPGFASFTLDDKTGMGIPSISRLLNRIDVQHTLRHRREKETEGLSPKKANLPPPPVEEAHPAPTPGADLPSSRTQWFDLAKVIAQRVSTPDIVVPAAEEKPAPIVMEDAKSLARPAEIELSEAPAAESSLPSIQPSKRARERKAAPVLARWKRESFAGSTDPIAKAAAVLLPAGATDLLFLSRHPMAKGDSFSVIATAAFTDHAQFVSCWSGLKWAPDVVPGLWKELISTGVVQLAPPGEKTLPSSERNVIRAAFAVRPEDWMIVLRTGSAEQARGILVVLSKGNLVEKIRDVIPILSTSPEATKKAA